jgi:hypothetical protein
MSNDRAFMSKMTTASRIAFLILVGATFAACGSANSVSGHASYPVPNASTGYWPTAAQPPKNSSPLPWRLVDVSADQSKIKVSASTYACTAPRIATIDETPATITIHIYGPKPRPHVPCHADRISAAAYIKVPHPVGHRTINVDPRTHLGH